MSHIVFSHAHTAHRDLHSFPTRRSSDLWRNDNNYSGPDMRKVPGHEFTGVVHSLGNGITTDSLRRPLKEGDRVDRKSTRLNSSHLGISYAVFCLKKKRRVD